MQNKSLTLILLLLSIGSIYADDLIEIKSLWKWDCVQQTREWLSTVKSTEISPMVFQHMPYEHKLGGGYGFRFYNRAKYKKLSTTMSKRLLNTINQYDKSINIQSYVKLRITPMSSITGSGLLEDMPVTLDSFLSKMMIRYMANCRFNPEGRLNEHNKHWYRIEIIEGDKCILSFRSDFFSNTPKTGGAIFNSAFQYYLFQLILKSLDYPDGDLDRERRIKNGEWLCFR